jgi:hypothetical protein
MLKNVWLYNRWLDKHLILSFNIFITPIQILAINFLFSQKRLNSNFTAPPLLRITLNTQLKIYIYVDFNSYCECQFTQLTQPTRYTVYKHWHFVFKHSQHVLALDRVDGITRRDILHVSLPALGPTQPHEKWVLGLLHGWGIVLPSHPYPVLWSKQEWSYTSTPPLGLF